MGEANKTTVDFAARVDFVRDTVKDLEANQELIEIIGAPVAEKLIFVGKENNFGLAPIEYSILGEEKLLRVQQILQETLDKNLKSHQK